MTTTVIVEAHCSEATRVVVERRVSDAEVHETILRDGERYSHVVNDDIVITVRESPA